MLHLKKALLISAFFVPAFGLPTAWLQAAECPAPKTAEQVTVASVYDGDSLRLDDGRRVRLIGINTPELGRNGQSDQPLAVKARDAVRQLLPNGSQALLQIGQDPLDRHGRQLAHLYLVDGRNLEAELVERGLGFAISIPPNLYLHDCLQQAQQQARLNALGVWSEPFFAPRPALDLKPGDGGFGRYIGTVTRTGATRKSQFIEIDNKIFAPLTFTKQPGGAQISSNDLLNQQVELRGWLIHRKLKNSQKKRGFLPFMLNINHPDSLILCDTNC